MCKEIKAGPAHWYTNHKVQQILCVNDSSLGEHFLRSEQEQEQGEGEGENQTVKTKEAPLWEGPSK